MNIKLENMVKRVFDGRSVYARNVNHLVEQFRKDEYNQGIAVLKNIVGLLEAKKDKKIKSPIKIKTVGYEKGRKNQKIGKSIAGPDLRFVNTFSITYYPEDKKRPRQVGKFTVGNILWEKLPQIFSALEDKDYINIIKQPKRTRKTKQKNLNNIVDGDIPKEVLELLKNKGIETDVLPQLLKYGQDLLKGKTQSFILSLDPANRKNDLNWLAEKVKKHDTDPETAEAYHLMTSDSYRFDNEKAAAIFSYIIENRKKPVRGMIGSFLDDLYFKEARGDFKKDELKQIKAKVKKPITAKQALEIVKKFPGLADERADYNRETILKYFKTQKEFKDILNTVKPKIEAQNKEKIRVYQEEEPVKWSMTRKEYSALDDLFTLAKKGDKTDYQNLRKRVSMKDSERLFENLFIYNKKLELSQKLNNTVLTKNFTRVDESLESALDKLHNSYFGRSGNNTHKEKQRLYRKKITANKIHELKAETDYALKSGIIKEKQVKDVRRAARIFEDYEKIDKDMKEKINFIYSLTGLEPEDNFVNLQTKNVKLQDGTKAKRATDVRFNIDDFINVKYVSPEQKSTIETIYNNLTSGRLKRLLDKKEFALMNEYLNQIRDTEQEYSFFRIDHLDTVKKKDKFSARTIRTKSGLSYKNIDEVFDEFKALGEYQKPTKEIKEKVKEIAQDDWFAGYPCLDQAINEDKVMINPKLMEKIDQDYKEVRQAEEKYLSILDKDSVEKYHNQNSFSIEGYSTARLDIKDSIKAFSRKNGGIGMFWTSKEGWFRSNLDKIQLRKILKDLYYRNQDAGTKAKIRIV